MNSLTDTVHFTLPRDQDNNTQYLISRNLEPVISLVSFGHNKHVQPLPLNY